MNPVRSAALAVGLVLAVLVAVFATREAGQDRMTTHLVGAVAPLSLIHISEPTRPY